MSKWTFEFGTLTVTVLRAGKIPSPYRPNVKIPRYRITVAMQDWTYRHHEAFHIKHPDEQRGAATAAYNVLSDLYFDSVNSQERAEFYRSRGTAEIEIARRLQAGTRLKAVIKQAYDEAGRVSKGHLIPRPGKCAATVSQLPSPLIMSHPGEGAHTVLPCAAFLIPLENRAPVDGPVTTNAVRSGQMKIDSEPRSYGLPRDVLSVGD